MRPLQLRFFGIGSYAGKQELDFEHSLPEGGLFLIHGATGAGKTTILDAITFALYGEASGENRKSGKSFRADLAPADEPSWAELTFALGTEKYRVYRSLDLRVEGRKTPIPGKAVLYRVTEDGEEVVEKKKSLVTQEVTDRIGINHEQFCQIVLLPQGDFQTFLMANSKERSLILQKLFRTERFSQIEQRLKDRASVLEKQAKELLGKEQVLLEQADCESREELAARIREKEAETEGLALRVTAAQKASDEAQKAYAAGQETAKQFKTLALREKELAEKRAKLPIQQAFREKLAEAKKAILPLEREKQAKEREHEAALRQKEAEAARAAHKAAQRGEAQARKALAKEEAREPERRDLQEERTRLEQLRTTAEAYGKAREEAAKSKAARDRTETEAAALAKKLAEAETAEKAGEQREAELSGAPESLLRLETALVSLQQKAKQAEKIKSLQEECKKAEKACQEKQESAEAAGKTGEDLARHAARLRELYRLSTAFSLAEGLEEGDPCPVCGSTHHPRLAVREELVPTREELKQAEGEDEAHQKAAVKAQEEAVKAEGALQSAKRLLTDATASWEPSDCLEAEHWAALQKETKAQLDEAKRSAEELRAIQAKRSEARQAREALTAEAKAAQQALQEARSAEGAAQGRLAEMEKNLPEGLRAAGVLAERLAKVTAALATAEAQLKKCQEASKQAERLSTEKAAQLERAEAEQKAAELRAVEAGKDFTESLAASGLSREAYEATATDPQWSTSAHRERVEKRIREFDEELAALERSAKDAREAVAGKAQPDLDAQREAAEAAGAALLAASAEKSRVETVIKHQRAIDGQLAKNQKAHEALDREYRLASSLATVAAGTIGMHFQTYVQRAIFYDVMDAANRRLSVMSRQRFQLVMGNTGQDGGRGWEGLELAVLDADTGRARSVRSLSGGEGFLASLSLALGLSDVVQEHAGGVRLDTMFIDEGFGSLDVEVLDTALDALTQLQQEGDRLVGIISHVTELEARIPARLEVTRTETGSHARFEMGILES